MIPVTGTKGQLAETKGQPQRYRVVLVDESELTYSALRVVFARTGTFGAPAWATSVREGQRVTADLRPDIVLADVEIAGESGLTLCAWVRSNVPNSRPVVLTARNDAAAASVALGAGAAGYLLTSSPPDDLLFYLQGAASGQLVVDDRLAPAASHVW